MKFKGFFNEKPTLEAFLCVFDSISDIVKYVWDLRNIAKYLNYLEIWLDVNRRILAHQEYKKSWDIKYRKYFFILNIFEKHLKLTIFKEFNRRAQNGGGVPEKIAEFQIFTILMMSGNHLYAIIPAEFVMGSWIRFWKTRNWADAISNQFSYNSLQDPRMSIFDFGRYLTISVSITQKSKYIKYSGKIRLRINFEVEHIYWLLTRSDFLRVQKQAWSSKNPFSLRNRMAVKI